MPKTIKSAVADTNKFFDGHIGNSRFNPAFQSENRHQAVAMLPMTVDKAGQ